MTDLRLTKPPQSGTAVRRLQRRLAALGFEPGEIDGVFGRQTDKAVRAFQRSEGLDVDGVVGPLTAKGLGRRRRPSPPVQPGALTAKRIASILGCSVTNVRTNWPPILLALQAQGIDSLPCQVATLATIGTEVGSFAPISEYGDDAYFTRMYEGRRDLGNVRRGDGTRFHGRGYIQLTGRANYRAYGRKLGLPLEAQPELALQPDVAARVLVAYVADHRIADLAAAGDWRGVRRAVNGGLNGWDRFSKLVHGLEQSLPAVNGRPGAGTDFRSPLHLVSPLERSARVKEAQWTLAGHNMFHQNFHPGGIDGEYGPITAAAAEEAKNLLGFPARSVDRTYGQVLHEYLTGVRKLPPTYLRRRKKRMKELHSGGAAKNKAVDLALRDAQRHVAETPVNLTAYGRWYGMNGQPWCCMYVTYRLCRTGFDGFERGKFASYCGDVVSAAKQRQRGLALTTTPERGDLVVYNHDEHIEFFVEWVTPNVSFRAVGGNTSSHDGSRSNGGEVAVNTRFVKDAKFPASYFIRVGA
jgi:peptidoglycan hydrolase-like protein with peptidoglycan-binding domain